MIKKTILERDQRFFADVLLQMINNDVDAREVQFFIRITPKHVIKYTDKLLSLCHTYPSSESQCVPRGKDNLPTIGHISRFNRLVSKLQREDEVTCKVVLIGMKNKVPWWWKWEKSSRNSVWKSGHFFLGERRQLSDGGKGKKKVVNSSVRR